MFTAQYLQFWTSELQVLAKLLAVTALQWFSYVMSQPVTSVSPCKYGGGVVGVASMRGPHSSCPLLLWSSVFPSSIFSSWRPLVPPRLVLVVLPLYMMALTS